MMKTGGASGLRRRKGCRAVLRDSSLDKLTQMPRHSRGESRRETGHPFHAGHLFLLSYKKDMVRVSESFHPATLRGSCAPVGDKVQTDVVGVT